MSTNIDVNKKKKKINFKFNFISSDHTDKVLCVQFNLDYIVSGSTDKTIKV